MKKIKTIIRKEWAEIFKRRMVIFSVIFLPLVLSVIVVAMLAGIGDSSSSTSLAQLPPQFEQLCQGKVPSGQCMQYFMVSSFMIMFMMIPLFIPVNIAAYSIVGEKTTHSLEPLLATPITTGELLAGKNLASVIPAVLATWAGFLIFVIGSLIITGGGQLFKAFMNPMWFIAIIFTGPLLAILSVNFSVMVSSRVNDPRVAEQLSAVLIIPIVAVFLGQIFGVFVLNTALILIFTLVMIVVDAFMIYLSIRLFQREAILTRWK